MELKEQFIPYRLAKDLMNLGVDIDCFAMYCHEGKLVSMHTFTLKNSNKFKFHSCSAPLWQQVFDWFMKVHDLKSCVHIDNSYEIFGGKDNHGNPYHIDSDSFDSLIETKMKCLEELIRIVK